MVEGTLLPMAEHNRDRSPRFSPVGVQQVIALVGFGDTFQPSFSWSHRASLNH